MKIKSIIKILLRLDVRFANKQIKYLNFEDINNINFNTLNYIESLSKTEIMRRVKQLAVVNLKVLIR